MTKQTAIRKLIKACGGNTAFARLVEYPIDTVNSWSCGRKWPTSAQTEVIRDAVKWRQAMAEGSESVRRKMEELVKGL